VGEYHLKTEEIRKVMNGGQKELNDSGQFQDEIIEKGKQELKV
jgi:hypothetical protein